MNFCSESTSDKIPNKILSKSQNIDIIKNKINNNMFDYYNLDDSNNNNFNYSLKKNVFNPSKMSPPNDWLDRLEKRLKYNNYLSSNKFLNSNNE